jgi:hypothetical protein
MNMFRHHDIPHHIECMAVANPSKCLLKQISRILTR